MLLTCAISRKFKINNWMQCFLLGVFSILNWFFFRLHGLRPSFCRLSFFKIFLIYLNAGFTISLCQLFKFIIFARLTNFFSRLSFIVYCFGGVVPGCDQRICGLSSQYCRSNFSSNFH